MENQEIKTKRCPKCGRELPLSEFYVKNSAADGLQPWCKECQKTASHNRFANRFDSMAHYKGCNPELGRFTPRQLIDELKNRGYTGELQYVQKIKL